MSCASACVYVRRRRGPSRYSGLVHSRQFSRPQAPCASACVYVLLPACVYVLCSPRACMSVEDAGQAGIAAWCIAALFLLKTQHLSPLLLERILANLAPDSAMNPREEATGRHQPKHAVVDIIISLAKFRKFCATRRRAPPRASAFQNLAKKIINAQSKEVEKSLPPFGGLPP